MFHGGDVDTSELVDSATVELPSWRRIASQEHCNDQQGSKIAPAQKSSCNVQKKQVKKQFNG
jgi:hypothetical protein